MVHKMCHTCLLDICIVYIYICIYIYIYIYIHPYISLYVIMYVLIYPRYISLYSHSFFRSLSLYLFRSLSLYLIGLPPSPTPPPLSHPQPLEHTPRVCPFNFYMYRWDTQNCKTQQPTFSVCVYVYGTTTINATTQLHLKRNT